MNPVAGTPSCLLCGSPELKFCYQDPKAKSVTSDCKIWPEPPFTAFCCQCSHLQKLRDRDSARRTQAVYTHYDIYHLSDGSEQLIFQNGSNAPQSRSAKVIDHLATEIQLPNKGALLDVGCGNGAFLSAFGKRYPRWSLFGFEQDIRYQKRILSLPGAKDFYFDSLQSIQRKFDCVSLIHVFEHIPEPSHVLRQIHPLLLSNGYLLIQLPDILKNPFDMVVIDHYSHFSSEVLSRFVSSLGYEIVRLSTDWVHKEISLLLRPRKVGIQSQSSAWYTGLDVPALIESHQTGGKWLEGGAREAILESVESSFGIFGTAIAGTWVAAMVGERVGFFVDEDKNRIGKLHLGRPVMAPKDLKPDDHVFIAFPFEIAFQIQKRMKASSPAIFKIPPPFKGSGVPSFAS